MSMEICFRCSVRGGEGLKGAPPRFELEIMNEFF